MIGTWTPPGAIFTVQFDDEKLELKLIKKTEIPKDEPISWMTFDVRPRVSSFGCGVSTFADVQRCSMPRRTSTAPP